MLTRIKASYIVALLVLVFTGVSSFLSISMLIGDAAQVSQTQSALETIEALLSLIKDAESSQRGFVITGDPAYLENYYPVRDLVASEQEQLRALLTGQGRPLESVQRLEELIAARLDIVDAIVVARQTRGAAAASELVASGQGRLLMDEIRDIAAVLRAHELELLEARTNETAASVRLTRVLTVIGGSSSIVFLLLALVRTSRDIAHRLQTEQVLAENEARYRALVENASDLIVTFSLDGQITYANPAFCAALGYPPDALAGRALAQILSAAQPDYATTLRRRLQASPGAAMVELALRARNGHEVLVEGGLTAQREHDQLVALQGIFRNVTERRRTERLKSEFVSTVSHELRTPLTSIRGSLGLIMGGVAGQLPLQARNMIEIAHKNSERLVRLINDILDIEKIESGKMSFALAPVDMAALVDQALEANRSYAEALGVRLELGQGLTGAWVYGDGDRLMQVLTNLLSNAAKFSPAGGAVEVTIARVGGQVRVSVRDQGPGVPAEFQGQIFEKFAQADSSDTRQRGGTGLGLSIVRAIIERLGGAISFDSPPGQGATFFFDLPAYTAQVADVDAVSGAG